MPPPAPGRTSSTPAEASTRIASRKVGRLIPSSDAAARSDGDRQRRCASEMTKLYDNATRTARKTITRLNVFPSTCQA